MADIDVAGVPERVPVTGTSVESIRVPLTAPADDVLMELLAGSELVADYCAVQADGSSLLLQPSAAGSDKAGAMLTAVKSVIDSANHTRAQRDRAGGAGLRQAEQSRARLDDELEHWWRSQH